MIERKVEQRLERFRQEDKALLITGARQVGKTFIIREFGKQAYQSFIEINFLEDKTAASLFERPIYDQRCRHRYRNGQRLR